MDVHNLIGLQDLRFRPLVIIVPLNYVASLNVSRNPSPASATAPTELSSTNSTDPGDSGSVYKASKTTATPVPATSRPKRTHTQAKLSINRASTGFRRPPPPASISASVILGSETSSIPRRVCGPSVETLSSEEDHTEPENEDGESSDRNNVVPSIIGGSFSIPSPGLRPTKVRGKRSPGDQSNGAGWELGEKTLAYQNRSSSIGRHLRGPTHKLSLGLEITEDIKDNTVYDQLITGANRFVPGLFRAKLLRFIAVLHLPFSMVERDEFRDLILYSSPHLRCDDYLLKSGASISLSLVTLFVQRQILLISMLQACGTETHLSSRGVSIDLKIFE
ncbi:hypothetical protein DL95DRAFT_419044 [Leptodontidium sp. 2 PMI_412]|nr:hypothetical protein DL95DRAFT_419044 [Leptodontidium sp. 2 PMI_412]